MKRIVLIDSDQGQTDRLENLLNNYNGFEVVGKANDGQAGLRLIQEVKPDILILGMILPSMDGLDVLDELKMMESAPKVLVLSAVTSAVYINKALLSGAEHYLIKPVKDETVLKRLDELAGDSSIKRMTKAESTPAVSAPKDFSKKIEERATCIFIAIGIPANLRGYHFLREAIKLTAARPDIINCITKQLYPAIAQTFGTTASKVERSIRHAIEVSWSRGKIENINKLFGVRVYCNDERPTNSEFIALLSEKIMLDMLNLN